MNATTIGTCITYLLATSDAKVRREHIKKNPWKNICEKNFALSVQESEKEVFVITRDGDFWLRGKRIAQDRKTAEIIRAAGGLNKFIKGDKK